MLRYTEHRQLAQEVVTQVDALKKVIHVAAEDHFTKRLRDLTPDQFPCLVAVIPGASGSGQEDAVKFPHSCLWFVLKHLGERERTDDTEHQTYQETELAVNQILDHLMSGQSSCAIARDIEWHTMEILPAYNYDQCDGWSISFDFTP